MKLYSLKKLKMSFTLTLLNYLPIVKTTSQKHVGLNLGARLTFNDNKHW